MGRLMVLAIHETLQCVGLLSSLQIAIFQTITIFIIKI